MNIIETGLLIHHRLDYSVRRLSGHDLPDILHLQEQALNALDHADTLQALSKEEYLYMLNGNGLMIGTFVGEKLIAIRALLDPPIDEEHLGLVLGLEDELEKIIYQEISIVHPDYRGNKLQQKLAYLIMRELSRENHSYRYVCATVAPHNIPSLKDKFNQGMQVGALIHIYDGKLRFVFVKAIAEHSMPDFSSVKKVPITDIQTQQDLLQEGWQGFQLKTVKDDFVVLYGKN